MKLRNFLGLIMLVLLCTSFTPYRYFATTWAGTAGNQAVTRAALQNAVDLGILTLKDGVTIPGTTPLRCVTKSELLSWVYVDPNDSDLSGRSNSQLIIKNSVTAKTAIIITLYGSPGVGCEEVYLNADANITLPGAITITFDWCADNNASATAYSLTINSGAAGTAALENTDNFGGSGCVGTDVRIKPSSLSVSSSLSEDSYVILVYSAFWDNGCNFGGGASTDQICVKGCS
jgi:hypothetical protein